MVFIYGACVLCGLCNLQNVDKEMFSIYVHSAPGFVFNGSNTRSALFYGRQLNNSIQVLFLIYSTSQFFPNTLHIVAFLLWLQISCMMQNFYEFKLRICRIDEDKQKWMELESLRGFRH